MIEKEESLQKRLVIGRKRDGRRQYDEAAKQELIQACLRPGASIVRTAMEHDVNPNLVRTWISAHQRKHRHAQVVAIEQAQHVSADTVEPPAVTPPHDAFIPVVAEVVTPPSQPSCPPMAIALHVRLPNGVEFDLCKAGIDELTTVVQMLGRLPCSGSTNG
ncbi:transposase [Cupriavidus basilensis]|uniref:transposase n=1 Tax=Cupriavidus basilensis TaxID=68895 RepID=UPI0023E8E48E|nr:transposase [Cupriavidus basilensis]MDF3881270.1 transposase [Cupriavidus basilensis]